MKKKIAALFMTAMLAAALLAGCGGSSTGSAGSSAPAENAEVTEEETGAGEAEEAGETAGDGAAEAVTAEAVTTEAAAQEADPAAEAETAAQEADTAVTTEAAAPLEDGTYTAVFTTDNSMFHVNEACDGKGTLTVKDGQMTIHVTLASKKIVNLFTGLAEDAEKEGAALLQPTTDEVTYSDGMTDEAYGFDIPVPAIGEEFDCALVGTKGKWYDHKVMVTDPVKAE